MRPAYLCAMRPWCQLLLLLIVTLLPIGCNRNDDALYAKRLDTSYFLIASRTVPGSTSITRVSGGNAQPNFQQVLGVAQPTDVLVAGGFLYVADGAAPRIVKYSLDANTVAGTFTTPGVVSGLAAGDRFVLLLDANQNTVYLMNQQWGVAGFVTVPLSFRPVVATYNADRFYIAGTAGQVAILNEVAVSVVTTLNVGTVWQAQYAGINNGFSPQVYWRNAARTPLFRSGIDANGNYLRDTVRTSFGKIRLTPFSRTQFGTEWLTDITQTGNRLNVPALPDTVQNFEADFRTALLFYQSRDSLFRFNLQTARREAAWPLAATLLKATHSYVRN